MDSDEILNEDDRLITVDVARAVEEQELLAYYQPVVDIASRTLAFSEALVRWTMLDGTIVPAGLFVPSLERTNTICGLDWYMVEEVAAFLEGAVDTPVAVPTALNFSTRHASDADFVKKLAAVADWRQLERRMLQVEFRQADLSAGSDDLKQLVTQLHAAGFPVIADNFAAGEQEMRVLAELGVQAFKLSSSLWRELDEADLAQLVAVANEVSMGVSAEGVEEEAELAKLTAAGVTYAQGFFFAKPMDGDSLKAFAQ